mmetsp:Transcript_71258/g.114992  ORF Transcript_71258/g.114992 Transcript_71258/m.114992 type:complete len:353 (+) Transcript_71258:904-1962(+)
MEIGQRRKLVDYDLVDISPEPQQVLPSEGCHLVPRPTLRVHHEVVDRKPNLGLQLWQSAFVICLDDLPLVLLKFLDFSIEAVFPHPRSLLHQGHQQQEYVMGFQQASGHSQRNRHTVICQKTDDGDHAHANLELALSKLFVKHSDVVPFCNLLRRGYLPDELIVGHAEKVSQLPDAVVDQVDKCVARLFTSCAMEKANFQKVRHRGLVIDWYVGPERAELGNLCLQQWPDFLLPDLDEHKVVDECHCLLLGVKLIDHILVEAFFRLIVCCPVQFLHALVLGQPARVAHLLEFELLEILHEVFYLERRQVLKAGQVAVVQASRLRPVEAEALHAVEAIQTIQSSKAFHRSHEG